MTRLLMKLARSEGRASRWEELLDELTPHQLQVLYAAELVDPWGEEREDRRVAILATTIANSFSVSGKTVELDAFLKVLEIPEPKFANVKGRKSGGGNGDVQVVSPDAAAAMMEQWLRR